jgi:hypothetical protein
MPRVHTRTRTQKGKYTYVCRACGKEVTPGQRFYTWKKRVGGSQYRHVACGYPRPSQLSGRKTAVIEDAIQDAENTISGWSHDIDVENESPSFDYQDVKDALDTVADEAESVAGEYESSADNMPENLQSGYQAEAMRDVAERLNDWASELRDWNPSSDEPDIPERPEPEGEEYEHKWEAYCADYDTAVEDWMEMVRSEATDAMSDMPEYEG